MAARRTAKTAKKPANKSARKSAKKGTSRSGKKSSSRAKTSSSRSKRAAGKARAASGALSLRSASPSFTVNDLEMSLAFYRDVLGFEIEETWKDDQGQVMGMSLKAGDVSLMIGQDDWKKGRDRKKGEGLRIYCETNASVDEIARRIEAKGGSLDSGPKDEPWGVRDISLTDPDGFKITIAQPKR